MNGEILILSIVNGHSAGVIKTPQRKFSIYNDMLERYLAKKLYWFSSSKGEYMLLQDMDPVYLWNCANLAMDTSRWRKNGASMEERTAWYDIIRKAIKDKEE